MKTLNENKLQEKANKHQQGQVLLRAADNLCSKVHTIEASTLNSRKRKSSWIENPPIRDSEFVDSDTGYIGGEKRDGMYSGKNR